ncbi:MAG: hypothetical protein COA79_09165 [Planctomycetota bacterium]|nr:MAG: hypothetical protein COA79_09165 [Planctomycetota bacterium]
MYRFLTIALFFTLTGFQTIYADSQTISFRSTYFALGDADITPATASSGLTITYSSGDTDVATIVNGKIHAVGFGTVNITASQAGNGTYTAATDVIRVVTVGLGLPDMLAVELPAKGQLTIKANEGVMATLLASPRAAGTTHNKAANFDFPLGGTIVVWSATDGGGTTRNETGLVWVFPYGQTPIGVSGPIDDTNTTDAGDITNHYSRALGGNNGSNIARTPDGSIHISWYDGEVGRPYKLWYRRGVQDDTTGIVTWTAPVNVGGDTIGWERSYISMSASDNAIHFAWAKQNDDIMYRRLLKSGGNWNFDPTKNTGLSGASHDNGPDIAAFNDEEVHIVAGDKGGAASSFDYGYRLAGSTNWTKESIAIPAGSIGYKYPAITVDHRGEVHVTFTARFRSGVWNATYDGVTEINHYYWKAWYMHRKRPPTPSLTFNEAWFESHDALNGQALWSDPGEKGVNANDVVADWISIQNDPDGNIYLAWHGTALNLLVARDDAFITRRPFNLDGQDTGWDTAQSLHKAIGTPTGKEYSWAPSICADKNGLAFPVYFYKSLGTGAFDNYTDMDSAYRVMLDGTFIDNGLTKLSNSAAKDMTTSFSDTTPHLYRHSNGRAWLDVLQGMMPTNLDAVLYGTNDGSVPYSHEEVAGKLRLSYVVYQREEVTNHLAPLITANPSNKSIETGQTATFSATAISPVTIIYQWNKNGNAISGATSSSYTTPVITLSDNSATYSLTVKNATSTVNETTSSATLTVQDTVAPSVPSDAAAANITQAAFTLSWTASTDIDGVTGYKIFKDGLLIDTVTVTTYNITNLTAATTYAFTVSAKDASSNESAQSTALAITTLTISDSTAPSVPTGLAVSVITQTTADLSWNVSTDDVGVTNYHIYQDGTLIGTSATASFSATGLTAGATYSFTLSAIDAANNNSAQSSAIAVMTLTATDTTAPSIPMNLLATSVTSTSLTLTWATSTDDTQVSGYKIFKDGIFLNSSTTNSLEILNLTLATTYSFTISAYDAVNNNSTISNALSVTTKSLLDTTAPSVPTGLTTSLITENSFKISWTASSDETGVTKYNIYKDNVLLGTSSTTSLDVTGLSSDQPYSISVQSVDEAGNKSALSSALTTTTLVQKEMPVNITISVITDSTVMLVWEESTSTDVISYTIFQDGVEIGTATTTSFEAAGLSPSTTYTYTINENNISGISTSASDTIIITTEKGNIKENNGEGSGGGGCSYSADMPISGQTGNIFMLFLFPLVLFFRRKSNPKK